MTWSKGFCVGMQGKQFVCIYPNCNRILAQRPDGIGRKLIWPVIQFENFLYLIQIITSKMLTFFSAVYLKQIEFTCD